MSEDKSEFGSRQLPSRYSLLDSGQFGSGMRTGWTETIRFDWNEASPLPPLASPHEPFERSLEKPPYWRGTWRKPDSLHMPRWRSGSAWARNLVQRDDHPSTTGH